MNIVRVHSVLIYLRHHGAQRNTHPAGQFQADTNNIQITLLTFLAGLLCPLQETVV